MHENYKTAFKRKPTAHKNSINKYDTYIDDLLQTKANCCSLEPFSGTVLFEMYCCLRKITI